jgi:predicted class III extradiol MEMO1 family dioxygenase
MSLIEKQDADGFATYLAETHNTICGRHPIGVLLRVRWHMTSVCACRARAIRLASLPLPFGTALGRRLGVRSAHSRHACLNCFFSCAVRVQLLEQTPQVKHSVKCLHYAQSSPVKSMSQSSVSYVSAIVTTERK